MSRNPERSLLCAVVQQAVDDLLWRGRAVETKSGLQAYRDRVRWRNEAYQWLFGPAEYFLTICSLTDIDRDYLLENLRDLVARACVGEVSP